MHIWSDTKVINNGIALLAVALLSGCATAGPSAPPPQTTTPPATSQVSQVRCDGAGISVDTGFPAGNIASCAVTSDNRVAITIAPEDEPPINCSPWYAFRIQSAHTKPVAVRLTYTHCGHRYRPKISTDGKNWNYLPQNAVTITKNGELKEAELRIPMNGAALFVSAQEIVVPATYDAWLATLADRGERFQLGLSAEKRAIPGIRIGNAEAREQVVLVGRQHPPEVTGAFAMFPFVETIAADTPLAKAYRARFHTTVVPMLNPDGVTRGHWRHNTGGVDLNRDWGPFTQPETKLMQGVFDGIKDNPAQDLRLMLDFHSTNRDIFYTIPDELPTDPALFTRKWLERYQELMPDYKVNRDARHAEGRPISKAYVFDTYGVPGVTFEIGDETDRALIKRIGQEAAVAMMETLLETPSE